VCKIAAISKVNDKNRNDAWVFMQFLGELMSNGNEDGLGYAAFDSQGKIFGERWLFNKNAFRDLSQTPKINTKKMENIYSFFGDKVLKDDAQAIVLHTRYATTERGIKNVHPFINDIDNPEVAIIHNGMINNYKKFKSIYSTCDSEVLAHLYHDNKVGSQLSNLNNFSDQLNGWFTVAALSKDDKNKMILDIFSDNGRCGSYFIKELDTRVFSTSASDILHIANSLGLTAIDHQSMNANTAFRIDVLTGEQIEHIKLKVDYIPSHEWEEWAGYGSRIIHETGSLDDEAFCKRWLGKN